MDTVLVTGASGHVGYTLTQKLMDKGYQVRAGVRGASNKTKTGPLRELGAEIVEVDLMQPQTLDAALDGCDGLFQVAAVFRTWAPDPERDIVEPSAVGGLNALEAARRAGVKRIVFTSSIAAVGLSSPPGKVLDEDDWNDDASHPYPRAKTVAERKARAFAEANDLDLRVICPGTVLGPNLWRHTPSTNLVQMILDNKLPAALPFGTSYVDVRDVGDAQILIYERDEPGGRFLAVLEDYITMVRLIRRVRELEPSVRTRPKEISPVTLRLGIAIDWLKHVFTGAPRELTGEMLREFGHKTVAYGNARLRTLGWTPRSLDETLRDTVAWLKSHEVEGI